MLCVPSFKTVHNKDIQLYAIPLVELVYYSLTPKGLSIQRLLSFSYLKLIHPEMKIHTHSDVLYIICEFSKIFFDIPNDIIPKTN